MPPDTHEAGLATRRPPRALLDSHPRSVELHMSLCRLCLREAKLVKSHIYPRWWSRRLLKEQKEEEPSKPHLLEVTSQDPLRPKAVQDGFHCNDILCGPCDTSFHSFENEAKKCLLDQDWWSMPTRNGTEGGLFIDLDGKWVEPLTRFVLSILWRAHWTAEEPFTKFSLGPHADRFGDFRTRPIEELTAEYPWGMFRWGRAVTDSGQEFDPYTLTFAPKRMRAPDGLNFAWFDFAGFSFYAKVDSQPLMLAGSAIAPIALGRPIIVCCMPLREHWTLQQMMRTINPGFRIE